MIAQWTRSGRAGSLSLIAVLSLSATAHPGPAQSEICVLPSQHAGVTFPVEKIEATWACRLQPIIVHYTTANIIGPLRTPLTEAAYRYLLDRPPMAATLVNRLGIASYRSEMLSPGRYWGDDGEGSEGTVELVYQDRTSRIYYLEGSHDSRFLRHITGKGVVLLRTKTVTDSNGTEATDSILVSYARLDNRVLSGLGSLLRPLIGNVITRKLTKGVDSINSLSRAIRKQPDRVVSEAGKPPALSADDVAFLKHAPANLRDPSGASPTKTISP